MKGERKLNKNARDRGAKTVLRQRGQQRKLGCQCLGLIFNLTQTSLITVGPACSECNPDKGEKVRQENRGEDIDARFYVFADSQ